MRSDAYVMEFKMRCVEPFGEFNLTEKTPGESGSKEKSLQLLAMYSGQVSPILGEGDKTIGYTLGYFACGVTRFEICELLRSLDRALEFGIRWKRVYDR